MKWSLFQVQFVLFIALIGINFPSSAQLPPMSKDRHLKSSYLSSYLSIYLFNLFFALFKTHFLSYFFLFSFLWRPRISNRIHYLFIHSSVYFKKGPVSNLLIYSFVRNETLFSRSRCLFTTNFSSLWKLSLLSGDRYLKARIPRVMLLALAKKKFVVFGLCFRREFVCVFPH